MSAHLFIQNGTTPHIKAFDIVAVQPTNEKLFSVGVKCECARSVVTRAGLQVGAHTHTHTHTHTHMHSTAQHSTHTHIYIYSTTHSTAQHTHIYTHKHT
jgi:hypothetical protein